MLKSYAGKKILQIMEKITVDFVSVASSIYHCVFFLDPPLVILDGDSVCPSAACSKTTRNLLSVADSFRC